MSQTPLDRAHAAMSAAPQDALLRLRFYERLADGELFLLLAAEAQGGDIAPELFTLTDGRFVLGFDREERLAAFIGGPAPFAALSGRALVAMLRSADMGLGLNFGAPSEILLPPEAIDWLAATLEARPEATEERYRAFHAPVGLPEHLVEALAVKLALGAGLARLAWLVGVTRAGGARGHLVAFIDALPGAEEALAGAVAEALVFSGSASGMLDVAFLASSDTRATRLAEVALRFDLPQPGAHRPPPASIQPDDHPPRLR